MWNTQLSDDPTFENLVPPHDISLVLAAVHRNFHQSNRPTVLFCGFVYYCPDLWHIARQGLDAMDKTDKLRNVVLDLHVDVVAFAILYDVANDGADLLDPVGQPFNLFEVS